MFTSGFIMIITITIDNILLCVVLTIIDHIVCLEREHKWDEFHQYCFNDVCL